MSPKFIKEFSSPIELEIQKELMNYKQALLCDGELHVLKSISDKIKLLENRLKQKKKGLRGDCR